MKTVDLNTNLIDSYFGMLRNLSPEIKKGIIERLSKAISKPERSEGAFERAFGAWESEKSADEIIEELRGSRNINRGH